jgi:putative inorganic carbon (hco3(-)) transporter
MSRAITTTPIAIRRAPPAPVPARGPRSRLPRAIVATILLLTATASLGAVAAHQPILALAAVFAGLAAISVAIRPDVAALVVVGLIYSNAPVVLVTFQNLPVALAAAVPAFLVAPLAYDLLVERKKVVITPALPWIVVYFVVEIIATITARDINNSFGELVTVAVEGVLLYTLLTNTVRTPGILRAVVWTLLLVGAAVATLSAYQYVTGTFGNN